MHPLVREIEAELAAAGAPPDGAGCVVAVSGGRDSMVLLHVLAELRDGHRWRLVVAHFHHGLRGAPADADAALVGRTARRLGLRFVCGRGDVRRGRRRGESLEQAARRQRHAFLARTARRWRCDWIATGHQADDQTELFLLRLLRGAGAAGLVGMGRIDPSPADPGLRLVRPLLPFAGTWLDAAVRSLGIDFREDASNRDPAFLRNRVRRELIPLLRERFQPALARVLGREQRLLRDQVEMIVGQAEVWLAAEPQGPGAFEALPVALQREVLRLQLLRLGVVASFELIEALRGAPETAVQVDPRRRVVRSDAGRLRVVGRGAVPPSFSFEELELELSGTHGRGRFGGMAFAWRIVPAAEVEARGGGECFDADVVGDVVRLRHWRPGDRFQPIGLPASAKLQDLFVNAKVPVTERRRRVLAETAAGELFWVEGLRIGERARLTAATRRVLVWRGRRE